MRKRQLVLTLFFIIASVFTAGFAVSAYAQKSSSADIPKGAQDDAHRAREAENVMTSMMGIPENGIPNELMEHAQGIAVIPHVVKGAFGIGGSYGKGLLARRDASGNWTAPAYIKIGGGSFGFQLGVEATDVVLVFTNEDGIRSLLNGKLTLGADASVAAGPVGRNAAMGTDILLKTAVYSYSRSKGLFAGVALDGAVITIDDHADRKVYGKAFNGEDILLRHEARANAAVSPFMRALEQYSPASSNAR